MDDNEQLRLVPGEGPSEDDRWSRKVTDEEIEAETRRATLRVIGQLPEEVKEPGAYEDLGAGNPEQRRLSDLRIQIMETLGKVGTEYGPLKMKDASIFMLDNALKAMVGVSN